MDADVDGEGVLLCGGLQTQNEGGGGDGLGEADGLCGRGRDVV